MTEPEKTTTHTLDSQMARWVARRFLSPGKICRTLVWPNASLLEEASHREIKGSSSSSSKMSQKPHLAGAGRMRRLAQAPRPIQSIEKSQDSDDPKRSQCSHPNRDILETPKFGIEINAGDRPSNPSFSSHSKDETSKQFAICGTSGATLRVGRGK